MLGKTHTAVGVATALCILQPQTISELVVGTAASAIGAVISDIDVDSSRSHKKVGIICTMVVLASVGVLIADSCLGIGVLAKLKEHTGIYRMVTGFILGAGICLFGKEQPHRSFMHSLLAMALLMTAVQIAVPFVVPYFAIAFASHLILDILNKKKVRLLYPLKKGICLNLCPANGKVNSFLGWIGMIGVIVGILMSFIRIL